MIQARRFTVDVDKNGDVHIHVEPGPVPNAAEGLRMGIEARAGGAATAYDTEAFMVDSLRGAGYTFMAFLHANMIPASAREGTFEVDLGVLRREIPELRDIRWLEGKIPILLGGGAEGTYWGPTVTGPDKISAHPVLYPPDTAKQLFERSTKISSTRGDRPGDPTKQHRPASEDATGQARDIFISHVEEDANITARLAEGVESAGYTTWYYERDSVPGVSYLEQVGQMIDQSQVVLLVISPNSLGSNHVTGEVVRAYEMGKPFVPVLRGVTHAEFQDRQPLWRQALGAATSIDLPDEPGAVSAIMPRILAGLKGLGVQPPGGQTSPEGSVTQVPTRVCEESRPTANGADGDPHLAAAAIRDKLKDPVDCVVDIHLSGKEIQVTLKVPWIKGDPTATCDLDPHGEQWAEFRRQFCCQRTNEQFFKTMGAALFEAAFTQQHHISFEINYQLIRNDPDVRLLRIQMHVHDQAIINLPWECMYHPVTKFWLGANPDTPLSRYVDAEPPPPVQVKGPLRLLVVMAEPSSLPSVCATQDIKLLLNTFAPLISGGLLEARFLEHAGIEALRRAMRDYRPHLFHFIGHGWQVGDTCGLLMETRAGTDEKLSAEALVGALRASDELRAVAINACTTDELARELAASGLVAIGMQNKIRSQAALPFYRTFYEDVANGLPLDLAVNRGRFSIRLECGGDRLDWCLPAIFLPAGQAAPFCSL